MQTAENASASAPGTAAGTRWRAHALGLTLISGWPLIGFPEVAAGAADVGTELSIAPAASLRGLARRPTMRVVREARWPTGELALMVHHEAGLGYLVTETGVGSFLVAEDAGSIQCAPACSEPWRWQRGLLNHALPVAATLRGAEVLHASAVALGGRAVAFAGRSTAGKTSVALNLVKRGAVFVADDAIAVEAHDDAVVVHPGPPLSNLARPERERLSREGGADIARTIGDPDAYKALVTLARADRELPLSALYLIERDAAYESLSFVRLPPEPVPVLASSYVLSVRTPERLANQLDVCAQIARRVPLFAAKMPLSVDAAHFAAAVEEHAATMSDRKAR
jgi:hypothetical protein